MKKIFTIGLLSLFGLQGLGQSCNPLDLGFGIGGKAVGVSTATGPHTSGNILVQPDNKILHITSVYDNGMYKFGIIRFDANGLLDNTFGSGGKVFTQVGNDYSYATFGAIQPDGKIVVAGQANSNSTSDFALVRYNTDGTLDIGFGTGGKVITSIGSNFDNATAITLQSDGKIVVVGNSGDNKFIPAFAIARYNSDGSLDNNFGQNGKLTFRLGHFITYINGNYYGTYASEGAKSVHIQANGKIIITGDTYAVNGCYDYYGGIYCNPAMAITRLNADGSTDNSFGNNGRVIDSVSLYYLGAALLQSDGKIVVTGTGSGNGIMTRRYIDNGSPDFNFGTNSIVITPVSGQYGVNASCLLVQPDGKIIVGGTVYTNNANDFVVIRFQSNGSPDNSFNVGGIAVFHPGIQNSSDGVTGLALQGNKILAGGYSNMWVNTTNFNILIVRLNDNTITFTPPVIADGPLVFCEGGRVNLSTSVSGSLQWFKNGIAIQGATSAVYSATSSGSYSLAVNNSNGCGASNTIVVTSNPKPSIPTITAAGALIFCAGSSVTLNTSSQSSLQWYKDGNALSGETNPSYIALSSGTYTVKATNPPDCSTTSSPVIVITKSTAVPTITANGPVTFCVGGTVQLSTSNTSHIQWYRNGGAIANANVSNLTVGGSFGTGAYTESNGCATSNTINVLINSLPNKPPINLNSSTYVLSTTSGFNQYQWYLNGVAVPGATAENYTVPVAQLGTKLGDYEVRVYDINNCSAISDKRTIDNISPNDMVVGGIRIHYYPNPASNFLYVDLPQQFTGQYRGRLFDMTGRLMLTKSLNQSHNIIQVNGLALGIYQLEVDDGNGRAVRKILVVR